MLQKTQRPKLKKSTLKLSQLGVAEKKVKKKRKSEWWVLVDHADDAFKRYVRLRDSVYQDGVFVGECITCNRKMEVCRWDGKQWRWNGAAQGGHYVSCGKFATRWDELNVNLQCAHCNAWLDKVEMIERYTKALKLKYGDDVPDDLKIQSKSDLRPTRQELRDLAKEYYTAYQFTLAHPEGI